MVIDKTPPIIQSERLPKTTARRKPPLQAGDRLTREEFERRYQAHPEIKKAELIEGVVYIPSSVGLTKRGVPPLQAGDRLTRDEFERRYQAHPEIKKAELIEGVVYMASPVSHEDHGRSHSHTITCFGVYAAGTRGADLGDNSTVRLDLENVPQPDILLRLETKRGGRSHIDDDGYVIGAPELVVEVAASSASYDLHDKKRVYARNGVQEYLVILTHEQQIQWFALHGGVYEPLPADENGIWRSEVFPGLWFKPDCLFNEDLAGLLAVVQQGLQSPEHRAFVEKIGR